MIKGVTGGPVWWWVSTLHILVASEFLSYRDCFIFPSSARVEEEKKHTLAIMAVRGRCLGYTLLFISCLDSPASFNEPH